MADCVILLREGDEERASEIVQAFAERTGLEGEEVQGGTSFSLEGEEHEVEVVQTLNEIDPDWSEHLALGDPAG
jgi:hypothetical protein